MELTRVLTALGEAHRCVVRIYKWHRAISNIGFEKAKRKKTNKQTNGGTCENKLIEMVALSLFESALNIRTNRLIKTKPCTLQFYPLFVPCFYPSLISWFLRTKLRILAMWIFKIDFVLFICSIHPHPYNNASPQSRRAHSRQMKDRSHTASHPQHHVQIEELPDDYEEVAASNVRQ